MTKDVEEKDKKPEPDVDCQKRFDLACAKLKHALGLSKENLINYHIGTHTIEIYDIEGNLTTRSLELRVVKLANSLRNQTN